MRVLADVFAFALTDVTGKYRQGDQKSCEKIMLRTLAVRKERFATLFRKYRWTFLMQERLKFARYGQFV